MFSSACRQDAVTRHRLRSKRLPGLAARKPAHVASWLDLRDNSRRPMCV